MEIQKAAPSDASLIRAIAAQKDQAALSTLFLRHQTAAYNLALRITQQPQMAEDIFQDAMLVVWQTAGSFKETGSARSWILRIVALKSMNVLRRRQRERKHLEAKRSMEMQKASDASQDELEGHENLASMRGALEHLPASDRQMIVLHYGGGLSLNEIGKMLSMSSSTVSFRVRKSMEKLRTRLVPTGAPALGLVECEVLLTQAICSGCPVPDEFIHGVGQRLVSNGSFETQRAGKAARAVESNTVLWLIAMGVAGVLAAGAVILKDGGAEPPRDLASVPLAAERTDERVPSVHKRWTFNKGPAPDLKRIAGAWKWMAPVDGVEGHMRVGDYPCLFRPDVLIPQKPLRVKLYLRPLEKFRTRQLKWDYAAGGLWELSKGREYEELRVWRNRKPKLPDMKGLHIVSSYYFGKYLITQYGKDEVSSIIEHISPYPDQYVAVILQNFQLEALEIDTFDMSQISERFHDPEKLIRDLTAKGKLKLDPPRETTSNIDSRLDHRAKN